MTNSYVMRTHHTIIIVHHKGQAFNCLIDTLDFSKVAAFPGAWAAHWRETQQTYYVYGSVKGKVTCMHQLLLGVTDPKIRVDHKNHDGLCNLRGNLRKSGAVLNGLNRKSANKNSSTGIRGVHFHKRLKNKPWSAELCVNRVRKHLGYFASSNAARQAFEAALNPAVARFV